MPRPPQKNGGSPTSMSDESDVERRLRLYETIVSATPDLVYVFDLDHRFVYANRSLLELWGKTWDEAIGRNCLELGYEPWHAEMHDREIELVKATGKPIRGEVPFSGMAGRRIYDYIFTPVFGEDGTVEAIAGSTRDITERKEAEDAAARLYQQNSEILESITDAFVALDRAFKFTYVNRQAESVLEQQPGELLGRSVWEAFPGLVGSEFEIAFRGAMEVGRASNLTSYYPDHERWYQVNVYPSAAGITIYFRNATDEKLAEEQLLVSQRQMEMQARTFSTTLSSIPDFAYTFDREGRFSFANRALTDLLQLKPEEIVGKTFFDLPYPKDLAAKLQAQIEQVFVTSEPIRDETLFVDPAGGKGYYEYIFNPVLNANNEVEIVAGSTRDVTERVQAGAALAASEERYRSIINQTIAGVAETDLDGRFRTANDHLCNILGYACDELLSVHSIISVTHPDDVKANVQKLERLVAEGVPFNIQKRYVRKDGSIVWADDFVSPIRNSAGDTVAIAAVMNDITARKQVEEELRAAIEFDEAVMDNMGEGLYTVDTNGCLVTMNRAAEQMFLRTLDESRGKNMHSLMHYMHRDGKPFSLEECERREALAGRVISNSRDVFVRSDGTFFDAVYTAAPLITAGEVSGTVVVFRDATDEMRAQDLLSESESRFRLMADNVPTLVWTNDVEGRGTYFNRTWLEYTGRSLNEEVRGGAFADVHAEDRDDVVQVFGRASAERQPFECEYRLRRHDGIYRWMLGRGIPVITGDGNFLGHIGSCTDIDDIKRVEAELRESEERIRIAVDAARLVTWEWDLDEDVVYWSDRSNAVMGQTTLANPATATEFLAVLHIGDIEKFRTRLTNVTPGEPFDTEFRTERPDGQFRWISAYGQITRSNGGRPVRLSGVASDITERKQAEQELRESERKLSAVFHGTRDYVGLMDVNGILLETNRASLEFGPSDRSNEIGRPYWETVWFRSTPSAVAQVEKAVRAAADGQFVSREIELNRPDGDICYFQLTLSPIVDLDGKVKLIVQVAEDITGEKKAREELHRQALLIELSQEPIFVWEFDGTIVEWNHGAEILYGYTRSEAVGRLSHQLLRTETVVPQDDYLAELARTQNWSGELRQICEDGKAIVVESRQQILESGGRRLVLETNRDITERKFTERILQRYRMLSERSGDAIWFLDPSGHFMDVNEAAIRNYGYSREEFLAMNISNIRASVTVEYVAGQLNAANEDGIGFETVHRRKDGSSFPVDVTANAADFGGERLIMAIVRDISERKAAEDALKQSEERSQLAQEAGRVGIWDWDRSIGRTYWSTSMWKIYGEEPTGLDPDENYWSSHLHPADRDRVVMHLNHASEPGGADSFHDEFRIIKQDGSVGWIESTATIVRDKSGRAVRMYGVNIEITERKDAQDRIRLSENQLRLITNALPALIDYVDRSERYRYANSRFHDWFGMPSDEIIGKNVREVFGNSAYGIIKPWIDRALSGEKCTFETVITYKQVGQRYVNISYVPDIGVDGTVHGFYALTHDLTDLKRSQDLLRTSEARLGLMMESLTDYAIFSLDSSGKIDSWNMGAELIFGFSRDEALQLRSEELFTPEDRANGIPEKEMKDAREKGRALDERWHLRKGDTRFFASGVMIPLYVGDALAGYAKIATDLTERRRRAEELQRAHDELEVRVQERTQELARANAALLAEMEVREDAERQRADLLGRLVTSQEVERRRIARDLHDQLGQRLTALRLKIESLRGLSEPYEEIAARVGRLQEISEQLDAEVSFLAWELRPTALDDLGLVDAVGAFVTEWSRHYEISAEFHSDGLSQLRLDHDVETHLYRITQEALNNIVKHAAADHVTVMLEGRGGSVTLIIEDDGKGFDPGDDSITAGSSSGLGLVGMRERAMLIRGNVEIESAPGQGATIFVRVPISEKS